MKQTLHVLLLAFSFTWAVTTQAQTSENFDEVTVDGSGWNLGTTNPRIFGNWSMAMIDAAGAYTNIDSNFIDVTNQTLSNGGTILANGSTDKALHLFGWYGIAKTFVMKSTDATPKHFSLVSFYIDGDGSSLVAQGYVGGVKIVSQNFTATAANAVLVTLTDPKWQNIDEFRIEQADGSANLAMYLDDITVAPVTALPVTISTFRASRIESNIQLDWQMGVKDDIQAFIIQRSTDGRHFTNIDTLDVSTSTDGLHYQYIDRGAPAGTDYYRLLLDHQITGADDYSQIISVKSPAADWSLYPNPVNSVVTIVSPAIINGPATLNIISSAGATVATIQLQSGQRSWQIHLPGLSTGIYYLQIRSRSGADGTVNGGETSNILLKMLKK